MSEKLDELTNELIHSLYRMRNIMPRKAPLPIGKTAFMLLHTIRDMSGEAPEGIRISDLGEDLGLMGSTITQASNELIAIGAIERKRDEGDRRVVRIKLTQHGDELIAIHQKEVFDETVRLAAHLGEEDTRHLIRLLERILTYYSEITDKRG